MDVQRMHAGGDTLTLGPSAVANAGLYKMGVRYYQLDLARFTQPDPAVPASKLPGANTYTYASCNPTNNTDPTGGLGAYGTGSYSGIPSETGCSLAAGLVSLGLGIITSPGTVVALSERLNWRVRNWGRSHILL